MKGYQFRRQRPVLEYIADFMSKDLLHIIELDGIIHDKRASLQKDRIREQDLIQADFKVIRFTDEEVLTNIHSVARKIEITIDEISKTTPLILRQRGT